MKFHQALFLSVSCIGVAAAQYADNAHTSIKILQDRYNGETGLWKGAETDLWWQSGNFVEMLARFGQIDGSFKQAATDILSSTYSKAASKQGAKNWINDYYDDEGWWALAWIASYDLTGDIKYLNTAIHIFEDMTGGWNTPCNGGIWWDKPHSGSLSSISNELFLSTAAHLANRVGADQKNVYLNWAKMEWDWFWNSGVINSTTGLVNDAIDKVTCKNDGKTPFTYNQGPVLSGLSELAKATSDGGYIDVSHPLTLPLTALTTFQHARAIASATLTHLTEDGILTEPVKREGGLGEAGSMFKGAFIRGLLSLHRNEPQQAYADFFKKNADSVWSKARNSDGLFQDIWQGGSTNVNIVTHASGIDVLVAAAAA
jgi:predicted alpha-1,6-mannanase (GH76 family)